MIKKLIKTKILTAVIVLVFSPMLAAYLKAYQNTEVYNVSNYKTCQNPLIDSETKEIYCSKM